jgi:hypothetical protein
MTIYTHYFSLDGVIPLTIWYFLSLIINGLETSPLLASVTFDRYLISWSLGSIIASGLTTTSSSITFILTLPNLLMLAVTVGSLKSFF